MTKYCEDCKWFDHPTCLHPKNYKQLPQRYVLRKEDAAKEQRWFLASDFRKFGWLLALLSKRCGRKGRYFEWKSAAAKIEAVKFGIVDVCRRS